MEHLYEIYLTHNAEFYPQLEQDLIQFINYNEVHGYDSGLDLIAKRRDIWLMFKEKDKRDRAFDKIEKEFPNFHNIITFVKRD